MFILIIVCYISGRPGSTRMCSLNKVRGQIEIGFLSYVHYMLQLIFNYWVFVCKNVH